MRKRATIEPQTRARWKSTARLVVVVVIMVVMVMVKYGDDDDEHYATMELYNVARWKSTARLKEFELLVEMVCHMARGFRTLIMTLQSHHHASSRLLQMEKLRNIPKRLNKLYKDYFGLLSGTKNTLPLLVSMIIVI